MKEHGKNLLSLLACLALLCGLTACGGAPAQETDTPSVQEESEAAGETGAEEEAGAAEEAETAGETDAEEETEAAEETDDESLVSLQLGTSAFSLMIPAHFVEGEMTEEDIADDQVAYYHSDETLLDFDVYQFPKEKDTLAEYMEEEAAEYNASEVVTDGEINGIPVCFYRAVEESEGAEYPTITYAFEDNGEYVEVAFWLDGDTAEPEAEAIISTLTRNG